MRYVFFVFLALYFGAMFLMLIGTYGWFGQEQDPLSAVFLIPLGLPWNMLADKLGIGGAVTMIVAPLVNLGIIYLLCRPTYASGTRQE